METETNIIKTDPINLGAKGYYSLNVYREDGSEVVEKRVKDSQNVVTYEGAYQLFFNGLVFTTMYANIGTGTTELTRSSVGLGNRFSAISSGSNSSRAGNEVDNGDGTSTLTITRTMSFSLGSTTGTFSEVGLSLNSNGSDFIAGQLIKDELGNPTTITVLSDEQLTVTYTIELIVPNGEQSAPVIGTGSVTTPEGSVNYTVYSQPFFNAYAMGTSNTNMRYEDERGHMSFRTDNTGDADSVIQSSVSLSHNGSGVVTRLTADEAISPSDFSNTSIKWILSGYSFQPSTANTSVDPTTRLTPNQAGNGTVVVVEFDTPISKDETRSLKCQIQTTYNI